MKRLFVAALATIAMVPAESHACGILQCLFGGRKSQQVVVVHRPACCATYATGCQFGTAGQSTTYKPVATPGQCPNGACPTPVRR